MWWNVNHGDGRIRILRCVEVNKLIRIELNEMDFHLQFSCSISNSGEAI